ncbi:hypothetical protein [Desulforamulus aeronauticus]|nr:hypothetical protein [Desulforamulus aeronauticus]
MPLGKPEAFILSDLPKTRFYLLYLVKAPFLGLANSMEKKVGASDA